MYISGCSHNPYTYKVKQCIDCELDSVEPSLKNAKTPEDSLYALTYRLDNFSDFSDPNKVASLVSQLCQLNARLRLIDTTFYKLYLEASQLESQNKLAATLEKIKEMVAIGDKEKKIYGINSAMGLIRNLYNRLGLHEERFSYYKEKLDYYTKYGPIENTAICYHGIAGYYAQKADYDNAISYYFKAKERFKPFSHIGYINEIYSRTQK